MSFQNAVPLVTEEIKEDDVMNVLYAFRKTNLRSLLLSSEGGSISSFIRWSSHIAEKNILMIGSGPVASLAVTFFLCGKIRVATPDTTFFIHEARFIDGSGKKTAKGEAQMQALICKHENDPIGYQRWMSIWHGLVHADRMEAGLIAQETSLSAGTVMELIRLGHEFNVDDALRYGIIHDVIDSQQFNVLSQFGTYEPW